MARLVISMICGTKGQGNVFVKREVLGQGIHQLSGPRLVIHAEYLAELPEHLGSVLRNVFLIDVAFKYSFLYPIDEVLAKFSDVRLAFQLNEFPKPMGDAAMQAPAQLRLTYVHQPKSCLDS